MPATININNMIFEKITIAALSLGHKFVGVEFSQEHFDTAVKRVKAFYGLLEGDTLSLFHDFSVNHERY